MAHFFLAANSRRRKLHSRRIQKGDRVLPFVHSYHFPSTRQSIMVLGMNAIKKTLTSSTFFEASASTDWMNVPPSKVFEVVADAGPNAASVFKSLVVRSHLAINEDDGSRVVTMAIRAPMGLGVRESRMRQSLCFETTSVRVALHEDDKGMLFRDLTGHWVIESCEMGRRSRVHLTQKMQPGFPIPRLGVGSIVRHTGNKVLAAQCNTMVRDLETWAEKQHNAEKYHEQILAAYLDSTVGI